MTREKAPGSSFPWFKINLPVPKSKKPNLDMSVVEHQDGGVRYVEDRFLIWNDVTGLTTKIDMSRCSAISSFDGLYVVVDGLRYYPPLTFEQADFYWQAARNNYWLVPEN